jgi:branched-chain amino acid transport system ATP-binding protein
MPNSSTSAAAKILSLNNIEVVYDHVSLAIKGVSIDVPEGGMVALLGANGAGKSTTLKSISGLLVAERGEVRRGELQFLGSSISALSPQQRVKLGIAKTLWRRQPCAAATT